MRLGSSKSLVVHVQRFAPVATLIDAITMSWPPAPEEESVTGHDPPANISPCTCAMPFLKPPAVHRTLSPMKLPYWSVPAGAKCKDWSPHFPRRYRFARYIWQYSNFHRSRALPRGRYRLWVPWTGGSHLQPPGLGLPRLAPGNRLVQHTDQMSRRWK